MEVRTWIGVDSELVEELIALRKRHITHTFYGKEQMQTKTEAVQGPCQRKKDEVHEVQKIHSDKMHNEKDKKREEKEENSHEN